MPRHDVILFVAAALQKMARFWIWNLQTRDCGSIRFLGYFLAISGYTLGTSWKKNPAKRHCLTGWLWDQSFKVAQRGEYILFLFFIFIYLFFLFFLGGGRWIKWNAPNPNFWPLTPIFFSGVVAVEQKYFFRCKTHQIWPTFHWNPVFYSPLRGGVVAVKKT